MTLRGRAEERLVIDRLLANAREGRSGKLVLRGRAGIGKSALLEYAAQAASGMRVLRASGFETEAEFPFAGLHMLLRPALDRIEALPGPQAAALRRAFGDSDSDSDSDGADDQFLLGLAALSLLSELAEEQPLLCLVDDAHWLDAASAQALLFVARRLAEEGVVLIIAAREQPGPSALPLPPALQLTGLDESAAAQLLDERAPGLPPGLRDRVLAEAAGNPLALVELAGQAGGAGGEPGARGPGPLPAAERVREVFHSQLRQLADPARMLLLLAAAESSGELAVVLAAAQKLGIDPAALNAAERADVIRVSSGRLEFRHPLLRSAAYHSASSAGRRAAHGALAEALAGGSLEERDRRAWHLAAAATGPDERAAAELETVAERSRTRGGYAAVAAAYERAADLTPATQARAGRLLAAATAANDAGQLDRAVQLAARAAELPGDDLLRARLTLLRANMPTADRERHVAALPAAAALVAGAEPKLAASMLIRASHAAWSSHDSTLAAAAAAQLRELRPVTGEDSFAVAIQAVLAVGDLAADSRTISEYLARIRRDPAGKSPSERLAAGNIAFWAGDHDAVWEISAALAADCRRQGMVGWLAGALQGLAMAQHLRGNWADARASALEGLRLAADTGQRPRVAFMSGMLSWLAAHAGYEDGFLAWTTRPDGRVPDASSSVGARLWFHQGRALLDLGDGQYGRACDHLEQARQWWDAGTALVGRADLVEAAIRSGKTDLAREEQAAFDGWASQVGRQWARAVALRCRALVSADEDGDDAGAHYAAAVRLHDGAGRPFEQARTHLVYGEWLRRNRRRITARDQLSAALDLFEDLGAAGWARRARTELTAAGGRPDQRPARPTGVLAKLTTQEFQVASLAAHGMSNRDIAAQLFLSPRTVGYHLYKAYPKLGVTSRGELAALFDGPGTDRLSR